MVSRIHRIQKYRTLRVQRERVRLDQRRSLAGLSRRISKEDSILGDQEGYVPGIDRRQAQNPRIAIALAQFRDVECDPWRESQSLLGRTASRFTSIPSS